MEEKKLTDEEIVKALECCGEHDNCFDCPIMGEMKRRNFICREVVLDLIHRLQIKNAELETEVENLKKGARIVEFPKFGKIEELQKQVDELKDERENMQAEILRFEDMKFTQEHCDLYSENETLKQWLKRLNADLEYEKNWGKIQTKQAVKDTAKEIIVELNRLKNIVRENYGVSEQVGVDMAINRVESYFKQKGVEVE